MISPSPAQMRALQMLREGRLVWRASSPDLYNISIEPSTAWPLSPVTAKILVENCWVELKSFTARAGEYRITPAGRALTKQICKCKYRGKWGRGSQNRPAHDFIFLSGIDPATTAKVDWKRERLLCAKCWCAARCVSSPTVREGKSGNQALADARATDTAHGANRYVWGVGAVCQFHVENPHRR